MRTTAVQAITKDIRGISAESKFLLIGLLNLYGENQETDFQVNKLADLLQIGDRVVTYGLAELSKERLVQIITKQTGMGVPQRALSCGLASHQDYRRAIGPKAPKHGGPPEIPENHHSTLIATLLMTKRRKRGKANKQPNGTKIDVAAQNQATTQGYHPKLTVANKLALMVMLRYADQSGVVRNLGLTDLSCLTGIKPAKLAGQIAKLEREGYIQATYSGISHKALFGTATGGYFLNLAHPAFGEARKSRITVLYESPKIFDERSILPGEALGLQAAIDCLRTTDINSVFADIKKLPNHVGNRILSALDATESTTGTLTFSDMPWKSLTLEELYGIPASMSIRQPIGLIMMHAPYIQLHLNYIWITEYFKTPHRNDLYSYTQAKIDQMISWLLSNFWADIFNSDTSCKYEITKKIKKLFLPNKINSAKDECAIKKNSSESALVEIIFRTSWDSARRIQNEIKQIDIVQEDMNFSILPSKNRYPHGMQKYRVIIMTPKYDNLTTSNRYRITRDSQWKIEAIKDENEISTQNIYNEIGGNKKREENDLNRFKWKRK